MYRTFLDDLYYAVGYADRTCLWEEKEGKYLLKLEVPGYGKEDLSIEAKDLGLYITGKNLDFKVSLPQKANLETIKAECKNGILSLTLEKKEKEDSAGVQ